MGGADWYAEGLECEVEIWARCSKDIINHNSCSPGDIDAITEQMEKMISNDNLRHSIASESTLLAHTTFNVKTISEQLGELYEEVSGREALIGNKQAEGAMLH